MVVGLPPRPFLYTPDQIAHIISVRLDTVTSRYLYYEGRSIGSKSINQMTARNIAPEDMTPEWRVGEAELIRWMRYKGFKFYERAGLYSDTTKNTRPLKSAMPDSPESEVDPTDTGE